MRAEKPDVADAERVVDGDNQAVLVAANVEHRELAGRVRVWISLANIHEAGPAHSPGGPIPVIERRLCVLMSVSELAKGLAADAAHTRILSKREHAGQGVAISEGEGHRASAATCRTAPKAGWFQARKQSGIPALWPSVMGAR